MPSSPDHVVASPDIDRLRSDWETLASHADPDRDGWTRRAFGTEYRRSREWVAERMRDAGLVVAEDAAGNLVGTLHGRGEGTAGALVTGSHTDTVDCGGRFDGTIGVLGAVEATRMLTAGGHELRHDLRVVDYFGEEVNDFGLSCVGSRAISGALTGEDLEATDGTSRTLGSALADHTGRPAADALDVAWTADQVAGVVELHIEQGPRLEQAEVPIGVVSGIAGIVRCRVEFTGRPDHAGTMPMDERRDTTPAAAETVLAVESLARSGRGDAVGTAGGVRLQPDGVSVTSGRSEVMLELRSTDPGWLHEAVSALRDRVDRIATSRGLGGELVVTGDNAPVPTAQPVREAIGAAAGRLDLATLEVASGAGHDSAFLASLAPMGMIFVPSRDGRSHSPDEWTDLEQVADGTQVLAQTLLELDSALP